MLSRGFMSPQQQMRWVLVLPEPEFQRIFSSLPLRKLEGKTNRIEQTDFLLVIFWDALAWLQCSEIKENATQKVWSRDLLKLSCPKPREHRAAS